MNDPDFRTRATALIERWVEYDRLVVLRLLLRVPYVEGIREWISNEFDAEVVILKRWLAWAAAPGQNIDDLCKTFEPALTSLGWHLEHQQNPGVYSLIPALEWLDSTGRLVGFGADLLKRLKEAQTKGEAADLAAAIAEGRVVSASVSSRPTSAE